MEKRSTWSKVKEAAGWTTLLSALAGVVGLISTTLIDAPTSLRDYEGKNPKVFEMMFLRNNVVKGNNMRIVENTRKAWDEKKKAKNDSIAKVQEYNDSVKMTMAKKHMKPKLKIIYKQPMKIKN